MRPLAVETPEAALAALRTGAATGNPFGVVIIDSRIPGLDGFELAQRIREDPEFTDLTIVMLTIAGTRGDAERCRQAGVAAYLPRPVRQSDLLEAILAARAREDMPTRELVTRHTIREEREVLEVLVAEDNEFNQIVVQEMLRRWGHRVSIVATGTAAVEAVKERRYDLILMDGHMPGMDGFAATTAIRLYEERAGGHVPIVAMTALALPGDREACLAAGMDDYVAKPLRSTELYTVVRRAVRSDRQTKAATPSPEPNAGAAMLDRPLLLAEAGGDEALLQRLVEMFRAQAESLTERLRRGIAHDDAAEVREAAHALKGSIGFWSTGAAWDAALGLERKAQIGTLEGVELQCAALESALAALQAEMERL